MRAENSMSNDNGGRHNPDALAEGLTICYLGYIKVYWLYERCLVRKKIDIGSIAATIVYRVGRA